MKVLITGISGVMGRSVARLLVERGHEIVGLDRRPWPDAPRAIRVFHADTRKRPAEDVFRQHRPEAVIHMATVTHWGASREERYRINLGGTRAVFDHCHSYGVRQAIFVGRHTVYGAAPDTPLYRTEEDPPMAVSTFPDLADLVAADLYAGSALWRFPEVTTAVLRIVYTLGPSRSGTLMRFLKGPKVAMVLGFDPLFQFMHEEDAARAIALALEARLRGVFNVAGPGPVPLSLLCRVTGRKAVPLPDLLFPHLLGPLGLPRMPPGAVSHVKYPIVVSAEPFREATGFAPTFDEVQTMESFRWAGD
ncbi:MAG: SDR family oxidoreductase [Polyangia bacterium]|jgi:UDP-glucose 4-epimerase|nr:SDR family oxidoreductase [Polyangia bacterium]